MILLEFENKKYTIDNDYNLKPKDDFLLNCLNVIELSYTNPSQGFKTSFIVQELEKMDIKVIDFYDADLEESYPNIVY